MKKEKSFQPDPLDRRLLYQLDLAADTPIVQLAKSLNVPKETVAFRMRRLRQRGLIKHFRTTVHISRLGYYYYKLFFKFQQTTPAKERQIFDYLTRNRAIAYLAGLEGRYDMTFLVIAKNLEDLQDFLITFKARFGAHLRDQEILTMTSVHRFNFRFFDSDGRVRHTTYPDWLAHTGIDALDHLIIRERAEDARISLSTIARSAKTHINVIRYRLMRLKQAGILGAAVLDIDFARFGVEHYQVDFSLRDQTSVGPMIGFALTLPESTFATVTLGVYDLALEFAVANKQRLQTIIDCFKEKFGDKIIHRDVFALHEYSINWFPEKSPLPQPRIRDRRAVVAPKSIEKKSPARSRANQSVR